MFDWIINMLDNFLDWLMSGAFNILADLMFWIALIIAMWGIIAKLCGFSKPNKYGMLSILIYILFESCAATFRK